VLRLLALFCVTGPVVMAMAALDVSASPRGTVFTGNAPTAADVPELTRQGNETDDLRESVAGSIPAFGPARRVLSTVRPPQADGLEIPRDPPPDRPPRAVA
jgi:hypothetical protein